MKNTKKSLLFSVLALILCCALLAGTTLAWFTDTASTAVNKIQAGNLEIKLEMANDWEDDGTVKTWGNAEGQKLGWVAADSRTQDKILWEPGCTYKLPELRITNVGNLALQFKVLINSISGDKKLLDAIDFTVDYFNNDPDSEPVSLPVAINENTSIPVELPNPMASDPYYEEYIREFGWTGITLDTAEYIQNNFGTDHLCVRLSAHMKESAGNEYKNLALSDFAITVVATQAAGPEWDSIGNTYDKGAEYPVAMSASVTVGDDGKVASALTVNSANKTESGDPVATLTIPAGVQMDTNATQVTCNVEETSKPAGFTIDSTQQSRTFEVSVTGVATTNDTALTVELQLASDLGDVTLKHNGNSMNRQTSLADVQADQDYYYDNTTGKLTFKSATFSPFTAVYNKDSWANHAAEQYASESNTEITIATAEQLALFAKKVNDGTTYSGVTVKLTADIDLGKYLWTPIGGVVSYPGVTFAGTFDGQNHTIKNLNASDNTPNHAAAGLFGSITGKVQNLTLENVTVTSSHYAGAVVGYSSANVGMEISNCHVKNAKITSTPELLNGSYDNGDKVGGIIGYCVSGDKITNCSVENSTITGYRDLGGIAGFAAGTVTGCNVSNVTVTVDNEHNYKNYSDADSHNVGDIVGRQETNCSIESCTGTVTKYLPAYSTES